MITIFESVYNFLFGEEVVHQHKYLPSVGMNTNSSFDSWTGRRLVGVKAEHGATNLRKLVRPDPVYTGL